MSQYGIIFIVQNRELGDNVFMVGGSEFSIEEKLEDLNASTENGKFESIAFFVVSDIVSADESCQQKLDSYKIEDQGLFELEFSELMDLIDDTIIPYKAFDYKRDCLLIGDRTKENLNQKSDILNINYDYQKGKIKNNSNQAKPTKDALLLLLILVLIGIATFWKIYCAR